MKNSRIILCDNNSFVIQYEDSRLSVPKEYHTIINSFWQEKIHENSNIFNGGVIGLSGSVEREGTTTLIFQNTNYAHFMASQHKKIPIEIQCRSFYVSALILTSDGVTVFGKMGLNSFDAGRYQYIGGGMERKFMLEGESGYEQCVLCELEEELGLTGEHITKIRPLYYSLGEEQGNISLIYETKVKLTWAELVSQLAKHNTELVSKHMIPEVNELLFVTRENYETVLEGLLPAHLDENLYSSLHVYFSCPNSHNHMDREEILTGGNMNSPVLRDNHIFKEATKATESIHQLLCHVRNKGIDWVPQSFGIDTQGRHELEFLEGVVPHDTPSWLWDRTLLGEAAARIREWHDATADFDLARTQWLMDNHEPLEVVCHNDFAPYNCVFRDNSLAGLIDFDVCSPGPRLWDLAYTAYRFVPLWPDRVLEPNWENSPFTVQEMQERLQFFLEIYSRGEKEFLYNPKELILKVQERLKALSLWSGNFGEQNGNAEIVDNGRMYAAHGDWVLNLI